MVKITKMSEMVACLGQILSLTDHYFVKGKLKKRIVCAIIFFLTIPAKWDTTQQFFQKII